MINTETSLSVKETSEKTGLSEHTLRYYEKIGLLLEVERNSSGHRCYSEHNLAWIEFLKYLRATGMPLEKMELYVDYCHGNDPDFSKRLEVLKEHKDEVLSQLKVLQDFLATVNYKIDKYSTEREKILNDTSNHT